MLTNATHAQQALHQLHPKQILRNMLATVDAINAAKIVLCIATVGPRDGDNFCSDGVARSCASVVAGDKRRKPRAMTVFDNLERLPFLGSL